MSTIDDKIEKHYKNSKKLREIYMSNSNISYQKSKKLQNQQDEEYKKMIFLKKLRKELIKNDKNKKQTIRF